MTNARVAPVPAIGLLGLVLSLCGCSSSAPTTEVVEPPPPPPKPRLVCLRGLKESVEYPIRELHNYIGRGTKWGAAHINLTEQELPGQEKIAPEHARLVLEDGIYYLEDLKTVQGTFVNGQRLKPGEHQKLKPGDVIQIAAVQLQFLVEPSAKPGKPIPLSPLRLVCLRGSRSGAEYLLFEGKNHLGKSGKEPIEIDLDDQDILDRPYLSERHARITAAGNQLTIEDLDSTHGTYINRKRLAPGTKQALKAQDTVMLGITRFKVLPAEQVRTFKVPAPVKAQLRVLRGGKPKLEYRLYEGENYIGTPGDLAVDVDLSEQEQPDKTTTSPQHAVITVANGKLTYEDLNSKEGTFINRTKIKPGTKVPLELKARIDIGALAFQVVE